MTIPEMHYAISANHLNLVSDIIARGFDVNSVGNYYSTEIALHCASRYGYDRIVSLLLDAGANINFSDSKGKTALHYAAEISYGVCYELIHKGADINKTDNQGKTPLDCAYDRSMKSSMIAWYIDIYNLDSLLSTKNFNEFFKIVTNVDIRFEVYIEQYRIYSVATYFYDSFREFFTKSIIENIAINTSFVHYMLHSFPRDLLAVEIKYTELKTFYSKDKFFYEMYNEIFDRYKMILPKDEEWAAKHQNLLKLLSMGDMACCLMEYIEGDCCKFICSIYDETHNDIEEGVRDILGGVIEQDNA